MEADLAGVAALLADPARAAMLERLLELGWLARGPVPRGLVLTAAGRDGLAGTLACEVTDRRGYGP